MNVNIGIEIETESFTEQSESDMSGIFSLMMDICLILMMMNVVQIQIL
jgi:hypothetical protein